MPFCIRIRTRSSQSARCVLPRFRPTLPPSRSCWRPTYRPLGEAQLLLATALGGDSLVLLQAAAHDAGSDGEVAVVAVRMAKRELALAFFVSRPTSDSGPLSAILLLPFSSAQSMALSLDFVRDRKKKKMGSGVASRRAIDSRKAGGFPRERHFGGLAGR